MFKLEVDSPTGEKDYLYISNLNNSEKEIYNYCLSKKYDYEKVKELKSQFQNYYSPKSKSNRKGNENKSVNKTLTTSYSSYQKPSISYEKKSFSLFPFQIFITSNKKEKKKNLRNLSMSKEKKKKKILKKNKSISFEHSFKKNSSNSNLNYDNNINYDTFNKKLDKFLLRVKGVSEEFKKEKKKFNERYSIMKTRSEKYNKGKNYGILLYNRGINYLNKSKEKTEKLKNSLSKKEMDFPFKPYLNEPNELLLKSRKEKNYCHNNKDMLLHYDKYKEDIKNKDLIKIKKDKEKTKKYYNDENEEIFEPKINQKSKNIVNNYKNIFEKLYNDRFVRENILEKIKNDQKKNYPFKPTVNKKYKVEKPNFSIFKKYDYLIIRDEENKSQ